MSEHSPGPWAWGQRDGELRLYGAGGRVIATGDYRRGICVQGEGNAALIASAPTLKAERDELLAALKHVTDCTEEEAYQSGYQCDRCDAYRDLIRRIEGQGPPTDKGIVRE